MGAVALLTGCSQASPEPAPTPRASVTLRVLVVNEPALAEAINRLRGEWAERSGGELTTSAIEWGQLIEKKSIEADVIVFPSRYLGELCVRDWLRPLRPHVLESEDLQASDIFPLVRHKLMQWGGEVMALPLGLDASALRPDPTSHPAIALLVKAAPEATSDNREGVLFDTESMQPRITEPAFVGALERLRTNDDKPAAIPATDAAIPVLGFADQLIAVTSTSRNAASAFKLIAWLAQTDTSSQISRAKSAMLPVRESLASSPSWHALEATAEERIATGKRLVQMLTAHQVLLVPAIPGIDEYVAALNAAVMKALNGEVTPEKALLNAAQRWEQITEAHGRDAQREAYLKHLGISD